MKYNEGFNNLSIDELRGRLLKKPYKPFSIEEIPVFMNMDENLLPNEEFKQHPIHPVEVSNMGRIRFENKILLQRPDPDKSDSYGYLWVEIPNISKYQLVYRLVAETWWERSNPELFNTVHHITNNGMDNRPDNLLWVSCEQHRDIHRKGC